MAKTVGTLAYQIVADTRNFTQGVTLTRKETAALKGIMEATATPAQKMADSLAGLNVLKAKGALSSEQHALAVAQLNKEFAGTATQVPKATSALSRFDPALAGVAVASAGAALGLKLVKDAASFVVSEVTEAYERLDRMDQSAEKLGVSMAVFQDLTFASEKADIGISELSKSMDQMLVAVSKGETKKFAQAFAMLGVDVRKLKDMRPEQMLRELLAALEGVANQADKTRLAKTIFGDTDVLRLHVDSLDEANRLLGEMGVHISKLDAQNLSEMDAAWTEMNLLVDALAERIAADLSPAATEFARNLNDGLRESGDLVKGLMVAMKLLRNELTDSGISGALTELFMGGELGSWIMEHKEGLEVLGKIQNFGEGMKQLTDSAKTPNQPGSVPFAGTAQSLAFGMFGMGRFGNQDTEQRKMADQIAGAVAMGMFGIGRAIGVDNLGFAGDQGQKRRGGDFRNAAALSGSQDALAMIANAKFGRQDVWDRMNNHLANIDRKVGNEEKPPVVERLA